MAAKITATTYNVSPNLSGKIMKFEFVAAGSSDWIVFDNPIGACYAVLPTGAQNTCVYSTMDQTAADMTTTQTTVIYESCTGATYLPATNGYVMIDDEIIGYTAGGAATSGTLTGCSRGCFGTTAAIHTGTTDVIAILNTLVFANGTTGLCRGIADIIGE
jgi:hypothetical protein